MYRLHLFKPSYNISSFREGNRDAIPIKHFHEHVSDLVQESFRSTDDVVSCSEESIDRSLCSGYIQQLAATLPIDILERLLHVAFPEKDQVRSG